MTLSSLSSYEVVSLKSSFEYAFRLKCDYLIEEHIGKGYTREIAEKTVRLEHCCNKISDRPIYIIDNLEFYTCPCNFRNRMFSFFINALDAYDKGILPYRGSLSEQPAKSIEALMLLSVLKEEYKQEIAAKANAKNSRK